MLEFKPTTRRIFVTGVERHLSLLTTGRSWRGEECWDHCFTLLSKVEHLHVQGLPLGDNQGAR